MCSTLREWPGARRQPPAWTWPSLEERHAGRTALAARSPRSAPGTGPPTRVESINDMTYDMI